MVDFLCGDAREVLALLPDGCCSICITSPPYLGLRSYNLEPVRWADGEVCCLGLEESVDSYVRHLVEVFAEVHRVLHDEGVLFIVIGDSYARNPKKGQHRPGDPGKQAYVYDQGGGRASTAFDPAGSNLKEGDLCFVPHRVAWALQSWGWVCRDEIVWLKSNCLPASVKNRTTRQHEFVFLLTKQSSGYFYDEEPIREEAARTQATPVRYGSRKGASKEMVGAASERTTSGREYVGGGTRRPRSVWSIATEPTSENHFACFPTKLVERLLLCGSSEVGACPNCGVQWRRVVQRGEPDLEHQRACGGDDEGEYAGANLKDYESAGAQAASDVKRRILAGLCARETVAWSRPCKCPHQPPVPSVALDCFSGSGTVGLVAKRLGRQAILIDAKDEYIRMSRRRCGEDD